MNDPTVGDFLLKDFDESRAISVNNIKNKEKRKWTFREEKKKKGPMNIRLLKMEKLKTSPPSPPCHARSLGGLRVSAVTGGGGRGTGMSWGASCRACGSSPTAATHHGCSRGTAGDLGFGVSPPPPVLGGEWVTSQAGRGLSITRAFCRGGN